MSSAGLPGARGASCPHCGAANRDDARFCGVCGRAMSSTEPASSPSLGEPPVMIGREIAGRYRILAKLGEGGMGTVFRAEQISLKRTVAVKLLRPEVLGNQMLLRRFNAEAELVAKLNHPNTVNIYDFGQDSDGALFIAMELIEGRSLRSVIHSEAPLPPRRAFAIAIQVAASLADAHAHAIIHRDLKPDNVMLQDRGRERDIVRVLDFGIAKLRDDNRATQQQMTQQGDMLGTPQYMAPEQIRAEAIDGRTDVYALGCLLYVMVTGRLPHEASTILALLSKHLLDHPVPPSQRRPELGLSPALDRLILDAMAKDPAGRPPTMEAYGEQIAAALAELPGDPRSGQRSVARPAVAVEMPSGGPRSGTPLHEDTPAAYSAFQSPYAPAGPSGGQVAPYTPPGMPSGPGGVQPPSPYAPPGIPSGPGGVQLPPPYAPPGIPSGPAAMAYAPAYAPPVRPGRSNAAIIGLAVVLSAGAVVTALIVTGQHASKPPPDHDRDKGSDKRDTPPPPPPPGPDPWNTPSALDGTRLDVGQGVELVFPPGFETRTQNGYTFGVDSRGVLIAAGPIEITTTNDPKQLAQYHARSNNLTFDSMKQIFIGGVQRPMAVFHGNFNNLPVHHVAVPLIGPGYRIAVVFQAPTRIALDPAVSGLEFELYTRRIVLP